MSGRDKAEIFRKIRKVESLLNNLIKKVQDHEKRIGEVE